jgi:hypothetical protein
MRAVVAVNKQRRTSTLLQIWLYLIQNKFALHVGQSAQYGARVDLLSQLHVIRDPVLVGGQETSENTSGSGNI